MDSQTSSTLVVREAEDTKGKQDDIAKAVSEPATANDTESKKPSSRAVTQKKIKDKIAKAKTTKPKKPKKTVVLEVESSSDSDSDSDSTSSSSSDSSEDEASDTESSDTEAAKKKNKRSKKKREAAKAKKHARDRKSKKPIKIQTDSDSYLDSGSGSDSDSSSSSSSSGSSRASGSESNRSVPDDSRRNRRHPPPQGHFHHQPPPQQIFNPYQHYQPYGYYASPVGIPMGNPIVFNAGIPALGGMPTYQPPPPAPPASTSGRGRSGRGHDNNQSGNEHKRSKKSKRKSKSTNFKRVDQVWDSTIHNYKLQDTAEGSTDAEYEGYAFHVRRTFDWEGKYKQTLVDIKSKILRDTLQEVMGDIKGVSLVEEAPKLDPNLLFLYLEDMHKHIKHLKTAEPKGDKKTRKKEAKRNVKKREQLKVLVKYLDKDYEAVKNR